MDDDELLPSAPPAPDLQAAIRAEEANIARRRQEEEEHNQRILEWQQMQEESPEFVQEWRETFAEAATRMGIEPSWPAVARYAEEAGVAGVNSEPEAISFLAQLQHRADTGAVGDSDVAFLDAVGRARQRNQSHAPAQAPQAQMSSPDNPPPEPPPPGLSLGYIESMVRRSSEGGGPSQGYVESLDRTRNWDRRETPEQQGTLQYLTPEEGLQNPALQRAVAPTPPTRAPAGVYSPFREEEEYLP